MTSPEVQPEFLTVQDFAKLVSMSRSGVYKLAERGEIPTVRLGGAIRIPRSFVEKLREGVKSPPAVSEPVSPRPVAQRAKRQAGFQFWPK